MAGVIGGDVRFAGRERTVLDFAATQVTVLPAQVARLLSEPVDEVERLLADLCDAGLLFRDAVGGERADRLRITRAGLYAIGDRSAPPRFEPADRHAVGVAWLWLHARAGTFGQIDRAFSEREMRAEDEHGVAGSPFFVEPHEFGGRLERHYPDLMLLRGSERLVVELLLVVPSLRELEAVLRAYAADVRIDRVLFTAVDPRLGRVVEALAGSLELLPMARVQMVKKFG